MLPFEVITNSYSRNYRAKSLPTQPRADALSRPTSDDGDTGGEAGEEDAARRPKPKRTGPTSTRLQPICYALEDPFDQLRRKSLMSAVRGAFQSVRRPPCSRPAARTGRSPGRAGRSPDTASATTAANRCWKRGTLKCSAAPRQAAGSTARASKASTV